MKNKSTADKASPKIQLFSAVLFLMLGAGMLWVSYEQYMAYLSTGSVSDGKHKITLSGDGAISLVLGYLGMALFGLAFGLRSLFLYKRAADDKGA